MPWLAIALVPPALFAVSNYLDKYLLEKYFKHQGNGALIIFSSLIGFVALPFILIFTRGVFDLPVSDAVLITINGMLYVIALLPYFAAMREDEASVAAPLFQFIPVFGYILGYFMLGEALSLAQIAASLLIVIGGFVLSFDSTPGEWRFKWRILGMMTLSSVLMALNSVAFKFFALDASYWVTSFWGYVGLGLIGVLFLLLAPISRRQFMSVFRANSAGALGINSLNELVNIIGMFILNYALLLAPVAFIFLAGAAQPLFILVYGVILTMLFPRVIEENLERRVLIQKGIAVAILVGGAFLLDYVS